jgi:hypothetical protein
MAPLQLHWFESFIYLLFFPGKSGHAVNYDGPKWFARDFSRVALVSIFSFIISTS